MIEKKEHIAGTLPDYTLPPTDLGFTAVSFLMGFGIGFAIFFIFYKLVVLAIVGGVIMGVVNIFSRQSTAIQKRKNHLRTQFLDMLEALSVALRAGNPMAKALESARTDLLLVYQESSDIVVELTAVINKFNSAIPLSVSFSDFAQRSGLEDVASFASIYATIEGKSTRADEIVRETQKIIADKMTIEMEIQTMMTASKNEVNIMLAMPLVILLAISYMGAGFMDALYTTGVGRLVATGGLIVLCISFVLSRKYLNIQL